MIFLRLQNSPQLSPQNLQIAASWQELSARLWPCSVLLTEVFIPNLRWHEGRCQLPQAETVIKVQSHLVSNLCIFFMSMHQRNNRTNTVNRCDHKPLRTHVSLICTLFKNHCVHYYLHDFFYFQTITDQWFPNVLRKTSNRRSHHKDEQTNKERSQYSPTVEQTNTGNKSNAKYQKPRKFKTQSEKDNSWKYFFPA